MNNTQKVLNAFSQSGFNRNSKMRKNELEQFLNSLMLKQKGQPFDDDVIGEIWQQSSHGKTQVSVQEICQTIIQGQNIVQSRLLEISDQMKFLKEELYSLKQTSNKSRATQIQTELQRLGQQKVQYQQDLRLLTQPFGINIISFMSKATASRNKGRTSNPSENQQRNLDEKGNQIQLKWLFILTLLFGIIEIIVIYKKYDFLNLIVFTCLLFIFLMNHFDRTYIKSLLGLLIISQCLDAIWLLMNSSDYWSPPGVGTSSGYQKGYLKLIILVTYLGVFLKIPLGVFLYHYRNVEQNKNYDLDFGVVKFSLTPNKINPITHGIDNFSLNN